MPGDEPGPALKHIAIDREPDREHARRPPNPFGSSSPRGNRTGHGASTAAAVAGAVAAVTRARARAGIDPDRLVVVELSSFDRETRDVLEQRFNAAVVDERIQPRERRLSIVAADSVDLDRLPTDVVLRKVRDRDVDVAEKATGADLADARGRLDDLRLLDLDSSDTAPDGAVATWDSSEDSYRVAVQFETVEALNAFRSELDAYCQDADGVLPQGIRTKFFDSVEHIGAVAREDRIGSRLRREGLPHGGESLDLDVDLWHPGTAVGAREAEAQLRRVCERGGGRVLDVLHTRSLVLARVTAARGLIETMLDLDIVARVDLPPLVDGSQNVFREIDEADQIPLPSGDEPLVGVIDSGVLSGHPLLRGWVVDERDFGTTEATPADKHGHGTGVAGLVVYGDVSACLESGTWVPRVLVCSGKVLEKDAFDEPAFPTDKRPEKLVAEAVRYFHGERGCRVFNLSLGSSTDVYATGGRQFAWAEVLDELARELDVVIVVSTGNTSVVPEELPADGNEFREMVRDGLLEDAANRLVNPATAALAVTVGSLARFENPRTRPAVPGAPRGGPSPFTRAGPGYQPKESQRAVKPEFVAYGGNWSWRSEVGRAGWRFDVQLAEPTLRIPDGGRLVTARAGTSFSAPHVSFAAAHALRVAEDVLGGQPTANSVRALMGVASSDPPCGRQWLRDPDEMESWEKLRLAGYGTVDVDRVLRSAQNDAILLAEDAVLLDHWQIFRLPVPPGFTEGRGRRGVSVALAFDPPVRASRREYLAQTMWLEVFKGLTDEQVVAFRTPRQRGSGNGGAPSMPQRNILDMRPTKEPLQWSTLQVRKKVWSRSPKLPIADGEDGATLHVLVGSQKRFDTGLEPSQGYSLAVRFWHQNPDAEIHQYLKSHARVRARERARVQARR